MRKRILALTLLCLTALLCGCRNAAGEVLTDDSTDIIHNEMEYTEILSTLEHMGYTVSCDIGKAKGRELKDVTNYRYEISDSGNYSGGMDIGVRDGAVVYYMADLDFTQILEYAELCGADPFVFSEGRLYLLSTTPLA